MCRHWHHVDSAGGLHSLPTVAGTFTVLKASLWANWPAQTSFAGTTTGTSTDSTSEAQQLGAEPDLLEQLSEELVEQPDGHLCVKGHPGCKEADTSLTGQTVGAVTAQVPPELHGINGGPDDKLVDPKAPESEPTKDFAAAEKAEVAAALKGNGEEGGPPVTKESTENQGGKAANSTPSSSSMATAKQGAKGAASDEKKETKLRASDLWEWTANVQMRRAKQAALIADRAVTEAWRQQHAPGILLGKPSLQKHAPSEVFPKVRFHP